MTASRAKHAGLVFLSAVLGLLAASLVQRIIGPGREGGATAVDPSSGAALALPEPPVSSAREGAAFPADREQRERAAASDRSDRPRETIARLPANPTNVSEPRSASPPGSEPVSDAFTNEESATARGGADRRTSAADAARPAAERPLGWRFLTTVDQHYESDAATVWNGTRSVVIGKNETLRGQTLRVNALWQGIDAAPYRGSRIELSVHARGRGANLFLRAVTEDELERTNRRLPMVPSTNRYFVLPADAGWTRLAIVAEIPADTVAIYFGFGNDGAAPLWLDDAAIASAENDTEVTAMQARGPGVTLRVDCAPVRAAPANLNFELTERRAEGAATAAGEPGC